MNNEPESMDPHVLRERYAAALGRLLDLDANEVTESG